MYGNNHGGKIIDAGTKGMGGGGGGGVGKGENSPKKKKKNFCLQGNLYQISDVDLILTQPLIAHRICLII